MTEDEAKQRWCPFARVAAAETVIVNQRDLGDGISVGDTREGVVAVNRPADRALCLGSACMAWRALFRTELRHRDGHVVRPGEVYLRGNATEQQVADGGYCGLAGPPA